MLKSCLEYYKTLNKTKAEKFRFLHISTDEVYGSLNFNESKFLEITPYNPSSPYSASKASSDHLVRAWNKTYNLPVLITNCSNNYGPFQFPEKLIPHMILNCLNHKSLPIYGDGSNGYKNPFGYIKPDNTQEVLSPTIIKAKEAAKAQQQKAEAIKNKEAKKAKKAKQPTQPIQATREDDADVNK